MDAKIPSNCSFSWRSISWGRELLRKGIRWKIGDGNSVRVFSDAWLPNLYNGTTIQRPLELVEYKVAELLDRDGEWEKAKLEGLLWPVEMEGALQVDRLPHSTRDKRYWIYDPKGECSVKTGYLAATAYFETPHLKSEDESARWWKFLWSFDLPPRVRIFAWRVFRNINPSELNLFNHHYPIFGRCGWCRRGWGSTSHTLIYCEKIRTYWMKFEFWNILKKWEGFTIWEIGGAMQNGTSRELFEQWIMGLWLIWKALCAEKHKNQKCSWTELKTEASVYLEAYTAARSQAAQAALILPQERAKSWFKPVSRSFRLDVDYATDDENGTGGVGAILRNANGDIVLALSKPILRAMSTLHGELKALVHGIRLCVDEGKYPIEAFTDSLLAVMAIAEDNEKESILYDDLFEFFAMVKRAYVISVSHVRREGNQAAHALARFAKNLDSTVVWRDNWPSWLSSIVIDDSV